jgi:hypothetical protein
MGSIKSEHYFNIANIDHYDAILGIPFMSIHDVQIAPGPRTVTIAADETIPLLSSEGGRSGHTKMVRKSSKPARPVPRVQSEPAAVIAAGCMVAQSTKHSSIPFEATKRSNSQ